MPGHRDRVRAIVGGGHRAGIMTKIASSRRPALALALYRLLGPVVAPVALARARKRMAAEDIPTTRAVERNGHATQPRPPGQLVWFHAASIGESLSILPLVETLAGDCAILVTSGTATSAKLLATRLPEGAVHQFAPLDTPAAAGRFLRHWHPDIAIFVESEIWPNLIESTARRATPLMLINARMSERALHRWARMPASAHAVFSRFQRIVTQDQRTLDGLRPFVSDARTTLSLGGNMKAAASPLPVDNTALAKWRDTLGGRISWVASSTHDGEDPAVLQAHDRIRETHSKALLILVPRHPHRGSAIAEMARRQGFETARLSAGETVTPDTAVLVADTLGELGLWYRLSPIVFLAGSFGQSGGHNPWEPIALGAALLHGPNVANAENDYRDLHAAGAAIEVADGKALGDAVLALVDNPDRRARQQDAGRAATTGADGLVARIASEIRTLLESQAGAR